MTTPLRLAILGAGGLGKGMLLRAEKTPDFTPVAIVDSSGYVFDTEGIPYSSVSSCTELTEHPDGIPSTQSIIDLFTLHADAIDVVFVALPNLPVDFIPSIISQIADQTDFKGIIVDALKRTKAVNAMTMLDDTLRKNHILYITGAGATPGFLSTIAAVAAQSFVEVTNIDIRFGVGIANWNAYCATIREDFIHLEGFDADKVAQMSDAEIEEELAKRNGILELTNMEHADDIILELAGICTRDKVTVGGIVDTRNAQKPVSTQVTVTGRTISGIETSHVFTASDETTMVDNVCGPALGFLRQGYRQFRKNSGGGLYTSADLLPRGPVEAKQLAAV